jgi:hypothetical protein
MWSKIRNTVIGLTIIGMLVAITASIGHIITYGAHSSSYALYFMLALGFVFLIWFCHGMGRDIYDAYKT